MRLVSRITGALVVLAALAACVRGTSSRTSETVAVAPVVAPKLSIDLDAAKAPRERDAADIEGRVLDSITVHSAHERTITREGLGLLMDHQNELMGMIDTLPEFDGSAGGVLLVGIVAGSVVSKLGFENGDRIDAVNGRNMEIAHAVEVYTSLRDATELNVDVWRQRAPTKVVIHVR